MNGLKLSNVRLKLSGSPGAAQTQDISAQLYGGNVAVSNRLTPGAEPGYVFKTQLNALNAAPFLKDLIGKETVSGLGNLTVNLNGTHMLKADYTVPGTRNDWTTSLNIYGINQAVTFRDLIKLTATLDTGKLSNTMVMNYRNGYTDALTEVYNVDTKGLEKIRLDVPSHITFDWQGRYAINNKTSIRAGIKNLFDRNPPLSLRASSGHQVGFDPRYADPMLRTFYITGSYKF